MDTHVTNGSKVMKKKVIEYGYFPDQISQELVDLVAQSIQDFKESLDIESESSYYEIVMDDGTQQMLKAAIQECLTKKLPLLTFSLTTLHKDKATAIKISKDLMSDGIDVYFLDLKSTMQIIEA